MDIETTKGVMDDSLLTRNDVTSDTAEETVNAIEYYLAGELVHRSVHVVKKSGNWAGATAASLV